MARRPIGLVVLLALGLLAAACSDPPSSGEGADVEAGGDGEAALPDCPLDALDEAAAEGPVEITLWYGGIGGPVKETMEAMVDGFNAGQDQVRLVASDQGGPFAEVWRKFQ